MADPKNSGNLSIQIKIPVQKTTSSWHLIDLFSTSSLFVSSLFSSTDCTAAEIRWVSKTVEKHGNSFNSSKDLAELFKTMFHDSLKLPNKIYQIVIHHSRV